ncbi:hypothetical protein REPUB_Repub04eG0019400 [Reevesia pubescens]
MFRQSPSRNQRSKGIKLKHVLQICLLLGVCFWLIYQVKHSHDKRKEFDEKDAKASVKAQSDDVILKLGRKDPPHVQEVSKNYKHEEEEEDENGVEEENKHDEEQEEKAKGLEEEEQEGASKHEEEEQEEGSKHEEEEQDEASKHEEEELEEASKHEEEEQEEASKHEEEEQEVQEDEGSKRDDEEQEAEIKDEEAEIEGRGDGDDEVDENEQEKVDGEADREEEFLDEEKEREAEGDDKVNEEKENEEKEGQEESDNLANDENHDGGGRNAHEAREEHYKADDASSAVSHDTQIIHSEADKLDMENSNDNSTMNVLEHGSKANTTEDTNVDENMADLKVDEGKHSEGGSSLNVTYTKENDHESGSSNSEHISLPNTTNTTDFIDQASNNSTEVGKETGNNPPEVNTEMLGSLQNGTSAQNTTKGGVITEEKYKEQVNETISNGKEPDSNTVDSSEIENVDSATRDSSNTSADAESGMSEDIAKINATAGGDSFGSPVTKEIIDSTQNEKSEGDNESGGTDENSDTSSFNETVNGGQHDPIESSDNTLPQEVKDARVDLSTLPDITTEGSNNEDAAAE